LKDSWRVLPAKIRSFMVALIATQPPRAGPAETARTVKIAGFPTAVVETKRAIDNPHRVDRGEPGARGPAPGPRHALPGSD
jgi:hypothetical protein